MKARFWKNLLITVAVGPIVGGTLFMAALDIRDALNGYEFAEKFLQVFNPLSALFYYAFGGLPALLNGLATGFVIRFVRGRTRRIRFSPLVGIASTLVVVLVASSLSTSGAPPNRFMDACLLLAGAAASFVSSLLSERYALKPWRRRARIAPSRSSGRDR